MLCAQVVLARAWNMIGCGDPVDREGPSLLNSLSHQEL